MNAEECQVVTGPQAKPIDCILLSSTPTIATVIHSKTHFTVSCTDGKRLESISSVVMVSSLYW